MYQRYKERFGTAGVVVGVIALVLALVTGAYAAGGGLSGKQKKEVEKIAKKYAGKPGANGTNGSPGAKGDAGAPGTDGTNGAPGESVKVTESAGAIEVTHCNGTSGGVGGSKFEVGATKTYACNGKNGTTGFTETLPSGKTEMGTWGAAGLPANLGIIGYDLVAPISFNIPLAAAPAPIVIGFEEGEGEPKEAAAIANGECAGTVQSPGAGKGKLCIFMKAPLSTNLASLKPVFVYSVGATLLVGAVEGEKPLSASGTWAVTAE